MSYLKLGDSQRWWNNYDTTGGSVSFYAKQKKKKKDIAMIIIGRERKENRFVGMESTGKIRISK